MDDLKQEYSEANARAAVDYELLSPRALRRTGIDLSALRPPPRMWVDRQYIDRPWKVLRDTGIDGLRSTFIGVHRILASQLHTCNPSMLLLQLASPAADEQMSLCCTWRPEFRQQLPMNPKDFHTAACRFVHSVRDKLEASWLLDAKNIVIEEAIHSGQRSRQSFRQAWLLGRRDIQGVRVRLFREDDGKIHTRLRGADQDVDQAQDHHGGAMRSERRRHPGNMHEGMTENGDWSAPSPILAGINDLKHRYEAFGANAGRGHKWVERGRAGARWGKECRQQEEKIADER